VAGQGGSAEPRVSARGGRRTAAGPPKAGMRLDRSYTEGLWHAEIGFVT
jgi:hypothetical protein